MSGPDRTLLAIGGGVLTIVVLAVVVVLALGEPDVTEYPAGTPEGTVQRYLRAAYDGDEDTARSLLSERARNQIGQDPISRPICPRSGGQQIRIESVDENDQRATVTLQIEHISGSGIDFDRYSWERQVALVFEDGNWKIDEPYFCA